MHLRVGKINYDAKFEIDKKTEIQCVLCLNLEPKNSNQLCNWLYKLIGKQELCVLYENYCNK